MLSLALMLTTQGAISPGNFALEPRYTADPMYGARLTRNHANAIGEGMLLAQAGEPPPIPPPAGEVGAIPMPARSLQDLRAEYQRLDESRPGLAGPIVMLAIGVPAFVIGFAIFYSFVLYDLIFGGLSSVFYLGFIIGIPLLVVGLVLAIVGGVRLGRTIRERSSIGQQMEEVKKQIEALESAPPPPPPPSSVQNELGPRPAFVMATF